jgi:hypothetical protein
MFAACLASFTEVEKDTRRTVNAVAGNKERANQAKQPSIFQSAIRKRLL